MDFFNKYKNEDQIRKQRIASMVAYQSALKEVESVIEIYKSISDLILFTGKLYMVIVSGRSCILGTELIDSTVMTLKNIKSCLTNGSLSDAYTLLRKVRDESLLFLYFLIIVRNNHSKKVEINDQIQNLFDWYDSKISYIKNEEVFNYIRKYQNVDSVISKHDLDSEWEELRIKLNEYVHTKGVKNASSNYSQIYDYESGFEEIGEDIKYIAVSFIFILLMIDSTVIMSTDYIDYLEMNMIPPDGSQYEIAPVVQKFIDTYLKTYNNELVTFIKETSVMNIN
ncbi:MAG: hypothetical protein WD607_02725 [Candidatus Paceibacterota bacterium]